MMNHKKRLKHSRNSESQLWDLLDAIFDDNNYN